MSCNRVTTGILWMIAAQLIFVMAWTAIKHLGDRLPLMEIIFFRAFFSLLILLPWTHIRHRSFKSRDKVTIFLRSLTGFVAMVLAFYAMIRMEIGNASTLFNTLPIFVALLAPVLIGEAFRKLQFLFVVTAFIGIVVIVKPTSDIFEGASFYALLAGFLAALAMIFIRKLRKTDSVLIITFYFTAFTTIASAPFAFANFIWPTPTEWGLLAFIGVCVTFAQLFLTHSYRHGHASTIAPFSYTSVIGAYVAGIIFFSEIPDILSIVGATVVIASGVAIMLASPPAQRIPGSTPGMRT